MLRRAARTGRRVPQRGLLKVLFVAALLVPITACSEQMFGDLGGRSSEWIGEVATTGPTTTTTVPVRLHDAAGLEWVNDEFGGPDDGLAADRVLAAVFARSADTSSFLQASRSEIVAVTPDVRFPEVVPTQVLYVTSQLVIETRELRLADDPTVAFGLWSVEPYTRSRSVGQLAVLNVSRDPQGVSRAITGDDEEVCLALVSDDTVCAGEHLSGTDVWRLESAAGVVHVWYGDPFRYELDGFPSLDEELIHQVMGSMSPLAELLPAS